MLRALVALCAFLALAATPAAAQISTTTANATTPGLLQPFVDTFRAALGNPNNGTGGTFASGRREINWDGVPAAFAAPNPFPANFFNVNAPRGLLVATPGTGFQVSAAAGDPGGAPVEFGNLNASYPGNFQTFSPQRLLIAVQSFVTDVRFVVPGTSTPALTRGFGVVFTDVETAGATTVEAFDSDDDSLGVFPVLEGANGSLSFFSVRRPTATIARIRIRSGNTAPPSGTEDFVAMDDFIYGEPQADPDGDGVAEADNCPSTANAGQENLDGDGSGDVCDDDTDGDGTPDASDPFPRDAAETADLDGDGVGDAADTDDDGDGAPDTSDAFPRDGAEQADSDGDGIGDVRDNCPRRVNADQADADGDGIGNACVAAVAPPGLVAGDGTAPAVSGLALSGRTLRFTVSEDVAVLIVVSRLDGPRRGLLGILPAFDVPAGANRRALPRRLGGRRLGRGRYRVLIVAIDEGGNLSRTVARVFRVRR